MVLRCGHIVNNEDIYVYCIYIYRCDSIYDMYVNLEIYIHTCSVF